VATYSPGIEQLGRGQRAQMGFFAPFAGKGQRADLWAGLFDNLGGHADQAFAIIQQKLDAKQIPDAVCRVEKLTDQGISVEQRDYFVIQRGVTTVALYVARFGTDLYVSWDTFVLPLVSRIRVVVAAVLLAAPVLTCCLLGIAPFLSVGSAFGGSNGLGNLLGSLSCVSSLLFCFLVIPALISLILVPGALVATVRAALIDRDPLAILRGQVSDFQQDDILALEQAVHHTVLRTLDEIGVEAKLIPSVTFGGVRRRLI
jgi:hypothetical protein